MNTVVLALRDPQSSAVSLRCCEYAAFLSRLHAIAGQTSEVLDGAADPSAALALIAGAAVLTTGRESQGSVRYVPTAAARERVGAERDGAWPQALASRQRKVFRRSLGAILLFPLEEQSGAIESLEVFITDWSPSPAACAIAVHPAHPLSQGLTIGQNGAFTGRYCRHPLTGDLLPIWVAPWVKPDFGTGVVLVNPGHDQVDLTFGRQVGLPIRFSLAPAGYDGSPGSWLIPPVIKSGTAIRTGSTDGLPFEAANAEYFRIMAERGLAVEYIDYGAGSFAVADFVEDGSVKIGWDARRGTVVNIDQDTASPVRLSASPVLAAVEPGVRSASLVVVAPSKSTETDLLGLRLLLAEPGLVPRVEQVPDVLLVGGLVGHTECVDDATLRLTMVVGAGMQETLSIKPQQVEASQRFLTAHTELASRSVDSEAGVSAEVTMAAGQVKELLRRKDMKQAFTQLYRLQKTLAKASSATRGDLRAYEALANVLTGLTGRYGGDELSAAWQTI